MVRKLLLVRLKDIRSDLMSSSPFAQYVVGSPLNVSPKAWAEEAGLSHHGFMLEGLKLKALQELDKWMAEHPKFTLLHVTDDDEADEVLARVGLRINTLAE